jgi:23S rRNA (cytidine1920-2'-O)/16S rRNA (cytidine1409-2'-O)-methyltransferase
MVRKASPKKRLIARIVDDGLADTLEEAEKLVRAGLVRVDGVVIDKPGGAISPSSDVSVRERKEFVGRGAHKLIAALDSFSISSQGRVCADVGACTGGFTDVLLRRGAEKVYAIDVGYGDLDWRIRTDPRVVVMERTNVRYVESLPDPVSLVTIDVSFISLTKVLPVVAKWLVPSGDIIALVKPQFEAPREDVGEGGIILNEEVHRAVLEKVTQFLSSAKLHHVATIPSPILGTEGNKEFLLHACRM